MIQLYGTATSMAKTAAMQTKVETKKKNGFVKDDGFIKQNGLMVKKQLTPEEQQLEQLRKDAENAEKNKKMLALDGKVQSGKKLSPEEEEYLMKNAPDLYRDYKEIQSERENYKEKLKNCETKEEVERVKFTEISKEFSMVKEVSGNPNIPKSAKIGILKKIMGIVNAVETENVEFKESVHYKDLIDTDAEKREIEKETREEITGEKAIEEAEEKTEVAKSEDAEGIEKVSETEKTDETAENEFFVSGENRDDAEKKLKKAQHRENIEIDFDKKTQKSFKPEFGKVTVQDVVDEIMHYVSENRGTGEGLSVMTTHQTN